ncbi:uncharacterized protein LOC115632092 [Scaptodrosophila lebanonensis]|uniref:Dynein axonemal assembly factor 4 n=1 Tax=Drosophila lebanonensis TaxID=7225 RepID=A0A6J2UCQ4_DROLE|nr:uncharacterized protein LOC115632092 [Scaptodrosophila lebanonensis]
MVQITQTEEDIKISIELNRLVATRKPDIVLLPQYLKYNNPPIYFERHLTQEIDEMASFCRIFKNEARIVLIKKTKGIWPELFQKLDKEELMKKRLEIADLIVERNKQRDQMAEERYAIKRRAEIEKELKRETAMRDRVKQFQQNACAETLMVGVRKEAQARQPKSESRTSPNSRSSDSNNSNTTSQPSQPTRLATPILRSGGPMATVRGSGRINISFSTQHKRETPKRESQEGLNFPCGPNGQNAGAKSSLDTLDE